MTEAVHPRKQQLILMVAMVTTHVMKSKLRGVVNVYMFMSSAHIMYEPLNMPA